MLTAITGCSGHVGENLVRELFSQGREVRALIHETPVEFEHPALQRVAADVLNLDSLTRAFAGVDVVYHLAACISVGQRDTQRARMVNLEGTRNVVRACLEGRIRRLIHFSSIHALSHKPVDQPITEERPLVPDGDGFLYDWTKAAGERAVLNGVRQGLDAVILNPTGVIGPYDYEPSPLGAVVKQLSRGDLPFLVAGGFDWVDVRDVVLGAVAAEQRGRTGERYILSGHWCSVRELAQLVESVSAVSARHVVVPAWMARTGFAVLSRLAKLFGRESVYSDEAVEILQRHKDICCDKACRELNYHSRPLKETLAETVAWFRANGERRPSRAISQ